MKRNMAGKYVLAFAALTILVSPPGIAGEADVVGVKIIKEGTGTYRFDVSVRHADEGWKHYADKWDVMGPDDTVLGTRRLAHPHENEQPFTRSLQGVEIPGGVEQVSIRAHDSVHKYGGAEMRIEVPR
ncbi:hypothetical protein BMS3Bbin10_02005 [bacterium BMS3Bbin10]|nr:hypothetical protein BMS3Bbin10_02005 [bacterium BMS3Bbin10]